MESRKLGKTRLDVSVIGLGTEHLNGQPRETVVSVIREAIERGVNYFDLVFSFHEYLDNLRMAFQGHRERVILTGHLGSTEKNGQYCKTRSAKTCERFFLGLLSSLGTDHVDVLFLHNFNSVRDWDKVMKPGGAMDLACRLREEGKARFLGISAHYVEVVRKAVESGQIDVVMFPINLLGHAMPGRKELQNLCVTHGVGLVAMKPFGGGKLLTQRGTFRVAKYQTGGESYKARITSEITPAQCLSYVLAQVGVCTTVPGVKSSAELAAALHTLDATEAERDFSSLVTSFGRYEEGECVYCNHCLPCPAIIDIAQIHRLADAAQYGISEELRVAYDALPVKASACTECGACTERCPFGVDVIPRMRQAVELFEPFPKNLQKGGNLMDEMIAYCGLVCSDCEAYVATQANDLAALERMAARAREQFNNPDLTLESAMCDGCLSSSERLCGYCFECEVRACGMERNVVNCAHCADYARHGGCEKLEGFFGMTPNARATLDGIRADLMA